MKLKKIASLALAGVMAVSMLAGCAGKETGNTNEGDTNVVTPVDNSLAAYINDEMTDEQKATVTFSADADLQAAVEKTAAAMTVAELTVPSAAWKTASDASFVALHELMDVTTAGAANSVYFTNTADKEQSLLGVYVVPGNATEQTAKDEITKAVTGLIIAGTSKRMPTTGSASSKNYIYSYTATVAMTKATTVDGMHSAYVAAVVFTQTPTERV